MLILGKGYYRSTLSLLNNMLQTVREKDGEWLHKETLQWLTEEPFYFSPRVNSSQSLVKLYQIEGKFQ
jgi:hypothetical protein